MLNQDRQMKKKDVVRNSVFEAASSAPPPFRGNVDLASFPSDQGFVIQGIAGSQTGVSVSGTGDVNGDGIPDLLIGADNSFAGAGAAYLVYGGQNGTINLANFPNAQGFIMKGAAANNWAGVSVSGTGDVNGDGIPDLLVGADWAYSQAGAAYLVYGGQSGTISLATFPSSQGFVMKGAANDLAGISVSGTGDVNLDGIPDLLIGTYNTGMIYLVYGGQNGAINLASFPNAQGFVIKGAVSDCVGRSVSGTGDVNGDHIPDLLLGAYGFNSGSGAAYLVYGGQNGTINLATFPSVQGFIMRGGSGDSAGRSVSGIGDVNGDGIVDLLIKGFSANSGKGIAYVVYGGQSGTIYLEALSSSQGFIIKNAAAANDDISKSVSGTGDINGDGVPDMLVGAWGTNSGVVYVIYGGQEGTINLDNFPSTQGFTIIGATVGDQAGYAVSGTGDVNGDGIADLLIGARYANSKAGAAYVVYGQGLAPSPTPVPTPTPSPTPTPLFINRDTDLSTLTQSRQGYLLVNASGQTGYSVSGIGDINRDGKDDFILGSPISNNYNGQAYVVYGGNGTDVDLSHLNVTKQGFSLKNGIGETGYSVSGAGDVNADGKPDLIIGAPFANFNQGQAYVIYGGNGTDVDLSRLSINGQGFALGNATGFVGYSVAGVGDVNRDGKDDVIIGAPAANNYNGQAYVVYGSTQARGDIDLSKLSINGQGFALNRGIGQTGWSVAGAGDVNRDGKADVIIGAPFANGNNGQAYVVYGGSQGDIDLTTLTVRGQGYVLRNGVGTTGYSVAGAGDVNWDGRDDMIIGAPAANGNKGQTYVVYGGSQGDVDLSKLSGNGLGFVIGNGVGETGYAVSSAGDVNQDGHDDLLIGAPFANQENGQAYVVYGGGKGDVDLSTLSAEGKGFVLKNGIGQTGYSVAKAGDVNGDGGADMLVGAPTANNQNGQGYLVYGQELLSSVTQGLNQSYQQGKQYLSSFWKADEKTTESKLSNTEQSRLKGLAKLQTTLGKLSRALGVGSRDNTESLQKALSFYQEKIGDWQKIAGELSAQDIRDLHEDVAKLQAEVYGIKDFANVKELAQPKTRFEFFKSVNVTAGLAPAMVAVQANRLMP